MGKHTAAQWAPWGSGVAVEEAAGRGDGRGAGNSAVSSEVVETLNLETGRPFLPWYWPHRVRSPLGRPS